MQVIKEPQFWKVIVEEQDNNLGVHNTVRFLEKINQEITDNEIEDLIVEVDLANLNSANSELIAQFVMIQTSIVTYNGRLRIVNANRELKSSFDVVMLDKIINIQYLGYDEDDDSEE